MQFTLSRLLASTALIALGLAGATLPLRVSSEELRNYPWQFQDLMLIAFWSSPTIIGTGVGLLMKRPLRGAAFGCLVSVFALFVSGYFHR